MRSVLTSTPAGLALVILLVVPGCFLFPGRGGDAPRRGQPCLDAAGCEEGLRCSAGVCVPEGTVGLAGPCWANADCQPGLYCAARGLCAPAGSGGVGAPCGTGAECAPELFCDSFGLTGTCALAGAGDVGAPCSASADCLAGLVCGPTSECRHPREAYPPFPGVDCAGDEDTFRVYFEVPRPGAPPADFFRLPFPNDARVSGSGSRRRLDLSDFPRPGPGMLGIDLPALYADALAADFRGWSTIAPVVFRFSKPPSFDTLTLENLHYVDVTPGAPESGRDWPRVWSHRYPARLYHCQNYFAVQTLPAAPMLPGHTYAVYLTTDIRGHAGEIPVQDRDLAAVLAAAPPRDPALRGAWQAYRPFREYLAGRGIPAAAIAGAAVFTVGDAPAQARALADAARAAAGPSLSALTLCAPGVTSPCEEPGGRGRCGPPSDDFFEVHGRMTVPIFQRGTPPYELPPLGGDIPVPPAVQRTESVCFALAIPRRATRPAAGWPLLVHAHGTGGSFRGIIENGVAGALASAPVPIATFAYEGVAHGARRHRSRYGPEALTFNVLNPAAARDNNLQGAVDVIQALRLPELGVFAVPGVGAVSFDPGRVYYFGHSQGANVGIPALATQDRAPAAVLSGAGAYLTRALLTKTSPIDAEGGLSLLVGEMLDETHPMMLLWQTYFDPVEILNFAPLLVARPLEGVGSKHVFMTWGFGDTFTPAPTLSATAQSGKWPVAEPFIEDIGTGIAPRPVAGNVRAGDGALRTVAVFQYQAPGYDGHFVATRNPDALRDWIAFLVSLAQSGGPVVP